jgi:hypothetical protein
MGTIPKIGVVTARCEEDMEEDNRKVKRFSIWAVFLIAVGLFAVFFAPAETVGHFFELLKDVITSLVI